MGRLNLAYIDNRKFYLESIYIFKSIMNEANQEQVPGGRVIKFFNTKAGASIFARL